MKQIVLPKGFAKALIKSDEDEAMVGKTGLHFKQPIQPNKRLGSGRGA